MFALGQWLALYVALVGLPFWLLWLLLRQWARARPGTPRERVVVATLCLTAISTMVSPYIAFKLWERQTVLARVPAPLVVAKIEYRAEQGGGIGPGSKESGLVIYRLTDASAAWARSQGAAIGGRLSGDGGWQATPIVDRYSDWHPYDREGMGWDHPHSTNVAEFMDRYGFGIPVKKDRAAEADRAIGSAGSYYRYGRGGSVTIIDPSRGRVYFVYAG